MGIGAALLCLGAALAGVSELFFHEPLRGFWKTWPPAWRAGLVLLFALLVLFSMAWNRIGAMSSFQGYLPWTAPLLGGGVCLIVLGFFGSPLVTLLTGLTALIHVMVVPILCGFALIFAATLVSWDRLKAETPGPAKKCKSCEKCQVGRGVPCPVCGELFRVREAAQLKAFFFGGGIAFFVLMFQVILLKIDPKIGIALYWGAGLAIGIPVYRSAMKRR